MAAGTAVAVVLAALMVGCGDDEPSAPPPDTSSAQQSSDGAPSGSGTPSGTPSNDPTGGDSSEPSLEPSVTPATGLLLREKTSQLRAPEGPWKRIPDIVTYQTAVGNPKTAEVISLGDQENFAVEVSLDEQVRFHNSSLPPDAIIERQPDILLDGQPAYYVQWYTKGSLKMQHDIGVDRLGRVIALQMDLDRDDPEGSAAIVAAVVASFKWR